VIPRVEAAACVGRQGSVRAREEGIKALARGGAEAYTHGALGGGRVLL